MAYILCVLTSGPDYAKQKAAIAEVSRIVYEGVTIVQSERAR